jgi:motility quorum-sensing regulator/GCU-specific mRNA interferase toxin
MPKALDKYTPTYDLESFKQSKFEIKMSALRGAVALGFNRTDIHAAVSTIERKHFYKSMTSYNDHHVWQDVYHVPYKGFTLYVKFTQGTITEFTLLSFKEK